MAPRCLLTARDTRGILCGTYGINDFLLLRRISII